MATADTILETINAALADETVSPDAMRHLPDPDAIALRIGEDGGVTEIPMRPGHTGSDTRTAIGCARVDCVSLNASYDMWIDDDGIDTGAVNVLATGLAAVFGHFHQPYFGPAVIARVDREGETQPLKAADVRYLRALLAGLVDDGDDWEAFDD